MTLLNKMGLTLLFTTISLFVFSIFVTIFFFFFVFMLDFGLLVWFVLSFIPTIEVEENDENRSIDYQVRLKVVRECLDKKVGEKK